MGSRWRRSRLPAVPNAENSLAEGSVQKPTRCPIIARASGKLTSVGVTVIATAGLVQLRVSPTPASRSIFVAIMKSFS